MMRQLHLSKPNSLAMWQIVLPLLAVANASYFTHNILGWIATLGFFLFIPGNLLLNALKPGKLARGESVSLSIILSLALLIIGGLLLNSLHFIGLSRPLSTLNVFVTFDVLTLIMLILNRKRQLNLSERRIKISRLQGIMFAIFTLLPLMAIGGANRLNNGASNILILILMGTIATLFILMVTPLKLKPLYPYAIFTIGLSILFCNSLRGWNITGHDIHHEFNVFYTTLQQGYWHQAQGGDPYNACLSITILPTIFAKMTTIPIEYIYKAVYQIIFAACLPTLFYLFRRFASDRKALLGAFVFMTFPTFTNDLPFLNRQEIAFIFVIGLLFVNFSEIRYKIKIFLTFIFILSIILSHYSSSYVTLLLLLISPIFYRLLSLKKSDSNKITFPLLNTRIMVVALLLTFAWNAQITASTGNLRNTVVNTFINVFGPESERKGFNYSLTQAPTSQEPQQIFDTYAASQTTPIHIIPKEQIPITGLGHLIGRITGVHNAEPANVILHASLAKILQLLVILGTLLMLFKKRHKDTQNKRYLIALSCTSLFALVLFTVLPQLAVDYDVTRLFQQSLMFLWLPSILLAEELFFFIHARYRLIGAAGLFAVLYLNLAGFIPQLTGGFPPQLPLNNSGVYYDFFYGHSSDIIGTNWLAANREKGVDIKFDTGAVLPTVPFKYGFGLVDANHPGYLYKDYTDTTTGSYRLIIQGVFIKYTNPSVTINRNKVYANTYAQIYLR